ncbi:MAG: hypothetical protein ACXAEN_23545, partial [Candidatus Thorarchaeota archaeon]
GFMESVFGFTFTLEPIRLLTLSLVGITAATVIGVFLFRRRHRRPSTRPFTYDLLTLSIGILITALALIAAVYPFTQAAFMVYWRYPADIGIVRGAMSIVVATIIIITALRRWRFASDRSIGTTQKILITSVGLMLLLSLSRHVFYGWYLLWTIPPLLLMRDRRLLVTILVCFLMLYPSYTHDNFANLGYSEEKTWRDDFTDVSDWSMSINFTDSGIDPTQISAKVQSIHGIGTFSINASQVENPSALSNVSVTWSRNVSIPVTSQTEFVSLVSASYDPTFGRLALFGLYFEGHDSQGETVSGTINSPGVAASNLTYVLWRSAFSRHISLAPIVQVTNLRLVAESIRADEPTLLIDIMYATEYNLITPYSIILIVALVVPNFVALVYLERALPPEHEFSEAE